MQKYEVGQKAELAYLDGNLVNRIATVVQKVAPWGIGLKPQEIGLVVRRAISMGVDPLNPHEIQIWKDRRGVINMQLAYTLMTEWVKRFKGKHTEPQYFRLTSEQLADEGLNDDDVAYFARFVMIDDLPNVIKFAEVFGAETARQMYTVTGLGVASRAEYDGQYFAANGRSKSWKVQKRALTDAYRKKFGTPTQAEIMELRRMVTYDAIDPEDWEATADLAPDAAVALAKSGAQWKAHNEAVHEAQNAAAADALFGGQPTTLDYDGEPLDDDTLEADIAHASEVAAAVPADLPMDNWTNFFHYVQEHLSYDTVPHVVNVLRPVFGGDNPKWQPWNNVKINGDPVAFWQVLAAHAAGKESENATN
jgi:hypothetical protein